MAATPVTAQPALLGEVDAFYAHRDDLIQDPYPLFRRMRAEAPVLAWRSLVIVTSWAETETVIRDMQAYSNSRGRGSRVDAVADAMEPELAAAFRADQAFLDLQLPRADPPLHTRLRSLAHQAFTPRRVAEMRPMIERIVDELLDAAAARGGLEVIDDLAYQLPLRVIGDMLGAAPEDQLDIRRWSAAQADFIGNGYRNFADFHRNLEEFRAYIRRLIVERRRTRHTDLLAALLEVEEDGDRLTPEELEATFVVLLFAGHETTTNLIGNLIHALLTQPDQLARLRSEPGLIGNAVEEILRWNTSSQVIHRLTTRPTELAGVSVPEGQTVRLELGAANRDPDHFDDPDSFDIARPDVRHLGFGIGPHYCLGQALARMETQVAVGRLCERFPRLELAGDARFRPNLMLRGLVRLPIAVGT
jgi:cytochrome P450